MRILRRILRRIARIPLPAKIAIAAVVLLLLLVPAAYFVAGRDTKPVPYDVLRLTSPAPDSGEPTPSARPANYTLAPYQGDVFAIKKPADWKVTDNLNAIETSDPDDPLTGVSGSIILGAFGEQTPDGHLRQVLDSIGATEIRYEHRSSEERVKERWTGLTWVIRTQTFTFRDANGNRVKAKASAGVLQGSGQYVAMISSFQTTPDKWGRWAPALERIMQTILITDGKRAGGYDKVRLPTAADVRSDSSPLMESWEYRNRSGDRNSQGFSDATLGQESGLISSSSGTSYTLPLADYDPTVGGYRNPDNSSEILVDRY